MCELNKSQSKHIKHKKFNSWPVRAAILTLMLAIGISVVAEILLRNVSIVAAVVILAVIITIGILADVVGIASASSSVGPFSAMAAKRVWGAKQSQKLVNNASLVSSICNDIVGDVCGIISGASGAAISARAIAVQENILASIFLSGVIAAVTVGGKALGKSFAVKQNVPIILFVGRAIAAITGDYPSRQAQP